MVNADASDFEDDSGDWSVADYQESAENLFGDHPFFGDTLVQQKIDEGFSAYEDAGFDRAFGSHRPALRLGAVRARGSRAATAGFGGTRAWRR